MASADATVTSQGTYSLWESAADLDGTRTLSGGGTKSTTDERTENARNGTTTHTLTGSDVYTLYGSETPVSGTTTLATTADVLTGNESFTLTESTGAVSGGFNRTTTGSGSATRERTVGSTTTVTTGAIGYSWQQSGDAANGVTSQSQSGTDRYDAMVGEIGALAGGDGLIANPVGRSFDQVGPATGLGGVGTVVVGGAGTQASPFGGVQAFGLFGQAFDGSAVAGGATQGLYASLGEDGYAKACFAAGTPILWEHGAKAVELIKAGDRVWSRDEMDPSGPVELKFVEEVFVRFGVAHQIVDAFVADFGVHGFGCLSRRIPELPGILESGSTRFPTIHASAKLLHWEEAQSGDARRGWRVS